MTTDQQQSMPPPSGMESTRKFWLDFAASIDPTTPFIGMAMEATRCALEAIRKEYEAQAAEKRLARSLERGDPPLFVSHCYNDITTSLLEAAALWGEDVANEIAGCDEQAARGMSTTIKSLFYVCLAARLRCTQRALFYLNQALAAYRQELAEDGSYEIVIV